MIFYRGIFVRNPPDIMIKIISAVVNIVHIKNGLKIAYSV